jgi:hypothetical protein
MFIDGDAAALLTTFGTAYSLLVTGGKIQNSKKLPFSGHINKNLLLLPKILTLDRFLWPIFDCFKPICNQIYRMFHLNRFKLSLFPTNFIENNFSVFANTFIAPLHYNPSKDKR